MLDFKSRNGANANPSVQSRNQMSDGRPSESAQLPREPCELEAPFALVPVRTRPGLREALGSKERDCRKKSGTKQQ